MTKLFDLVCGSLPRGYDPDNLKRACPVELWEKNPLIACAWALHEVDNINWDAYLATNQDVQLADMDPVVHFLKHGLFEGRKLHFGKGMGKLRAKSQQPKVSVIVPNHNHSLYLPYTINLLLSQSLKEIEIILVDDASTDGSQAILRELAEKDARIKLLELAERGSQHMARKAGVATATGQYIMFMDADDSLTLDACEKAWQMAVSGFDMVCFNASIMAMPTGMGATERSYLQYINRGMPGKWRGNAIIQCIYIEERLSDLLWNKIYDADMCKAAFKKMSDGFFDNGEDIYEALVLAANARNACKITDRLYNYRLQPHSMKIMDGVVTRKREASVLWPEICAFLEASGLNDIGPVISKRFLEDALTSWLRADNPEDVTGRFNLMASNFGLGETLAQIATSYFKKWGPVAKQFQRYRAPIGASKKLPARIGILYDELRENITSREVLDLCHYLQDCGYETTLFLEKQTDGNLYIPPSIRQVYLPLDWYSEKHITRHIRSLVSTLQDDSIDTMILASSWNNALLWQIMALKYHGIPAIVYCGRDFYEPLVSWNRDYTIEDHANVLACADKVICHTEYAEIYYRANNIDAECVPPPVEALESSPCEKSISVVIYGPIGFDAVQSHDALHAISEIARRIPKIHALFIGRFQQDSDREYFYKLVKNMELEDNVCVTGWTNTPEKFLAKAKILLSTAWHEPSPASIYQAQAFGLPCIIYDLPIGEENDDSLIRVQHGDYSQAAREAINLLTNEERLHRLASLARERTKNFTPHAFRRNLARIVEKYGQESRVSFPEPSVYKKLIGSLAFYTLDLPPWMNTSKNKENKPE